MERQDNMRNRNTDEMETTISFCRNEKAVSVWSSDTMMWTRFDKLCNTAPEFYQCTEVARDRDGDIISKTYRITDKAMLSFRAKKTKLNLTEEQRAAMVERLRRGRAGA